MPKRPESHADRAKSNSLANSLVVGRIPSHTSHTLHEHDQVHRHLVPTFCHIHVYLLTFRRIETPRDGSTGLALALQQSQTLTLRPHCLPSVPCTTAVSVVNSKLVDLLLKSHKAIANFSRLFFATKINEYLVA